MENPLIIDVPKSVPAWVRIRDRILTVLLWLLYFYLIRDAFFFLHWVFFDNSPEALRFSGTLNTLDWYLFIIAINSVVFIGWALYSQIRFRGNERRQFSYLASAADLGQLYGIPVEKVVAWQQARILTMRHDDDGNLLEAVVVQSE